MAFLFLQNMMPKILLLVLLFFSFGAKAQKLNYEVRMNDEAVGSMKAVREGSGKIRYSIQSIISYKKLLKIDLDYSLEAFFEKQILKSSLAVQKTNGKEHTHSKTERIENGYRISTLKGNRQVKHTGIDWNLCRLYFAEPAGISKVWSDTFCEMLDILPAGNHRYELRLPDGKSSFYTYHKGICILVETEQLFGKISFLLRK
jgi:hypothetical protein